MPKLIIGLVGRQGSGKGTVSKILESNYGAKVFRFSAILGEVLDRVAVERSRANLIKISEVLRSAFGEDVLAYAIERDAATADSDIVVIDGVRRLDDIVALEPMPQFILVEIVAPAETRYGRITKRTEKPGESHITFEEFLNVENTAPTEITIPDVEARAQFKIDNSGTADSLKTNVDEMMAKLHK